MSHKNEEQPTSNFSSLGAFTPHLPVLVNCKFFCAKKSAEHEWKMGFFSHFCRQILKLTETVIKMYFNFSDIHYF